MREGNRQRSGRMSVSARTPPTEPLLARILSPPAKKRWTVEPPFEELTAVCDALSFSCFSLIAFSQRRLNPALTLPSTLYAGNEVESPDGDCPPLRHLLGLETGFVASELVKHNRSSQLRPPKSRKQTFIEEPFDSLVLQQRKPLPRSVVEDLGGKRFSTLREDSFFVRRQASTQRQPSDGLAFSFQAGEHNVSSHRSEALEEVIDKVSRQSQARRASFFAAARPSQGPKPGFWKSAPKQVALLREDSLEAPVARQPKLPESRRPPVAPQPTAPAPRPPLKRGGSTDRTDELMGSTSQSSKESISINPRQKAAFDVSKFFL